MQDVIRYLEDSVMRFPDKIVCEDDLQKITYQELWNGSDIIASALVESIHVGMPVPIMMKKSCKTLIVMWGLLKLAVAM